ncbi:MAG: phage tail protein [Phycisphaerales bacterium]
MNRRCLWFVLFAGVAALTTWTLLGEGPLWGQTADDTPIAINSESFIYVLDFGDQQSIEYAECSGLGSYHEVEEQAAMTTAGSVVMESTPGVLRWHKITLRRPTPSDVTIWQWRKTMETTGLTSALRAGRISLYGPGSSTPLARWSFTQGWPVSLVFDGSQEELVIVHGGLVREGSSSSGGASRS